MVDLSGAAHYRARAVLRQSCGQRRDDVQTVYLQAIRAETSDTEREVLRKNLLDYCERDTLAMVRLACWRGR